jgi:hypothetical protein
MDQLDMQLFGSKAAGLLTENSSQTNLFQVFADSKVAGLPITVTAKNGISVRCVNGKGNQIERKVSTMVFVADAALESDFDQFVELAKSFAGYIILIVKGETVDEGRWIEAAGDEKRLFHSFSTATDSGEEFVKTATKTIALYETMQAHAIW